MTVTGNGSSVSGSTVAADAATIGDFAFEPVADNSSFTSANLKSIKSITVEGTSTKTGANATITMNGTSATLVGALTVDHAATAGVTIKGTTTSVHGGAIVLTNGTLTYTRGGNSTQLTGGVTLTKGTLTLGSNVQNNGATSQVDAALAFGSFNYTAVGAYTRTGTGEVTGTGSLIVKAGAAVNFDTGTHAFTVPNLVVDNTAGNTVTLVNPVTVSNSLTQTSGSFEFGKDLTLTGNTFTYTTGNYTAVGGGILMFKGAGATATFAADVTIPNVTVDGTLTLASKDANAKTVTVSNAFELKSGTINQGINNLVTNTAFKYTAGTINQGTGSLTWNVAAPVLADGFAVDNLIVSSNANVGTKAFTVNKTLMMNASITTSADSKLTLGNGIVITRTANAALLNKLPAFGGNTSLVYKTFSGAANIVTANELPATVKDLTVEAGANNVVLNASVTVNGTLSLANMLNAVTNNKTVTMADGSTLELKINGTSALDKNLVKSGSMSLVYNGANQTSTRELGAVTSGSYGIYNGAISVKAGHVALQANFTTNGTLTLDGANFDMNGNNLTLNNDVTSVNGGIIDNSGAAKALSFSGATDTKLNLDANSEIPATMNFTLNKTNSTNKVTFSGGNLDFANTPVRLYFKKGLLVASGNETVTLHQNNAVLLKLKFRVMTELV